MGLFFELIVFAILLVALSIHEASHAWAADRLGDPTARLLGRLSLNPVVHIDLIGTIVLPAIAIFSGFPIIGWAKPVPVNLSQLGDPRRDFMLIAAAGPASNLLQALVAAVLLRLVAPDGQFDSMLPALLFMTIQLNVLLAVFNLIPIPPLDGGNVIGGLLSERVAASYDRMVRPYGFLILYALLLTGALTAIILPPTRVVTEWLIP